MTPARKSVWSAILAAGMAAAGAHAPVAFARAYPSKSVNVENKPGGNGAIASESVARWMRVIAAAKITAD